jgi:hypothetical protein
MITLLWYDQPRYSGHYSPSGTIMTLPPRDAYRVTVREAAPGQWEWEILRDDRALEIRLREGLFTSRRAATAAGTAALCEFLKFLDVERVW